MHTPQVRIFFKYTNDNNPFTRATIRPLTVIDGLSKLGGYFAMLGILKIVMFMYNKKAFESSLKKRFQEQIQESKDGKDYLENFEKKLEDPSMVDDELVKTALSYEMIMQLTINHFHQLQQARNQIRHLSMVVENLEKKSQREEAEKEGGRRKTYQSNNTSEQARSRNGKVIPDVNTSDEGDDYRAVSGNRNKPKKQASGSYSGNNNNSLIGSIGRNSIHTEFERLSDQDD